MGGQPAALAAVLPEKLHPLVLILAHDIDAPVSIPPGRTLDPERAARLRVCCARLLRDDDQLPAADRAFKRRALTTLDQLSGPVVVHLAAASGVAVPPTGAPAAISATSAAVGSWPIQPLRDGYPAIGVVASAGPSTALVEPYPLPPSPTPAGFDAKLH